jgi:hypothetical protein
VKRDKRCGEHAVRIGHSNTDPDLSDIDP